MKSRLEEDLRISDLEGLVLNRLLVDVFKPKLCHERDVLVVAFLARHRETAHHLILYLSEGPFNFINIEASSSPDQDGNFIVLLELDRSREMFTALDQMLQYINQLAHTSDWHFKTLGAARDIAWNAENFKRLVPQDPEDFLKRRSEPHGAPATETGQEPEESTSRKAPKGKTESASAQASNINYRLMAKIIERQVTRSNLLFIKEFQKQIKRLIKDNRLILQHFKEVKSDHQYLYKQLELHQKRERLALLREQQDFKRIRDLQDRLSNMITAPSETSVFSLNGKSVSEIAVEPVPPRTVLESSLEMPDGESGLGSADDATGAAGPNATETEPDTPVVAPWAEAETVQAAQKPRQAMPEATPIEKDTPGQAAVESVELPGDAAPPQRSGELEERSAPPDGIPTDKRPSGVESAAGQMAVEDTTGPAYEDQAPPDEGDPVNKLFSLGMQASERKDYHAAIEHFTEITDLAPDEPRGYYNLAILYYRLKDYDTAHEYAKRALDLGARAARRILKKVENKQTDATAFMSDTIEIASADIAHSHADEIAEEMEADEPPEAKESPIAAAGLEASAAEAYEAPETTTDDGFETSGTEAGGATQAESAETIVPLEAVESTETVAPPETSVSLDAEEPPETIEPLETVTPIETEQAPETIEALEPVKSIETEQVPETIEALETITPIETEQAPETVEPLDTAESIEPVESLEPGEPLEDLEDYDLPTFPVLDGIEQNTATEVVEVPPETFENLDTTTISEIDLSSGDIDAVEQQHEHITTPQEPIGAIEPIEPSGEEALTTERNQGVETAAAAGIDWTDVPEQATGDEPAPQPVESPAPPPQVQPLPVDIAADAAETTAAESVAAPGATATDEPLDSTAAAPEKESPPAPIETEATAEAAATEDLEDYFMLGLVASDQKDYQQAIACFQKFIQQAPEEPRGYYNLAILYYRLKDYESAQAHAQRALDHGAGAARRILKKIRSKQGDTANVAMDTIEISPVENQHVTSGARPSVTDMAPGAADQETPAASVQAVQTAGLEAFDASAVEMQAVSAADVAEASKPIEPPQTTDTGAPTEFSQLKGMEEQPPTDMDRPTPESFEYMDTMAISNIDQAFEASEEAQLETENVFELSEPVEEEVLEAVEIIEPQTQTPPSEAIIASEVAMDVDERTPEVSETRPPDQPLPEPAASIEAKMNDVQTPPETVTTESPAIQEPPPAPVEVESAVTPVETPEDYFALGMAASDQKDYRQAIVLFQKFIEQAPQEPRGHYNLAILYYRQKEYAFARDCAERALNLGVKAARRILDKVDKKMGRSAASTPAETVSKPVDSKKPRINESARPPEVSTAFSPEEDTVIWDADELEEEVHTEDLEVEATDGHFGMSDDVIFFDSSQDETAAPDFDASIENKIAPEQTKQRPRPKRKKDQSPAGTSKAPPKQAQSPTTSEDNEEIERFFKLGQKAADQKEYLKAIKHFTKVTNLSPSDPRGYYNLAIVSYRLKFYETAREHAKRALELGAEAAKRIIEKIDAQQ